MQLVTLAILKKKGWKMNIEDINEKVKKFKIKQKFGGIDDLYRYLLKNVEFIGEAIGIQVQKPIEAKPFCLVGREKITERNILFFASKSEFAESIGELIILAGAFDVDIIIFFLENTNEFFLGVIDWLHKICNDDTEFVVGEVQF
jgi:hypothetical protein